MAGSESAVRSVSNSARCSAASEPPPEKTASFCAGVALPARMLSRRPVLMGVSRSRLRRGGGLRRMLMPAGSELRSEVDCGEDHPRDQQDRQANHQCHLQVPRLRFNRRISANARLGAAFRFKGILRDEVVLVQTEKPCNCADKPAIENASGQLVPLLIFQCYKKARSDARGGGNFLQRDASHFPLAF